MPQKKCLIICCTVVLQSFFIYNTALAQQKGMPQKDYIIETYLDTTENNIVRMREEERALRLLVEERTISGLSKDTPPPQKKPEAEPPTALERTFAFLGSGQFTGRFITGITYDDNVNLDSERRSDWVYNFNPSLNLKLTRGQSYLGLDYNFLYNYYLRGVSDNEHSHRLSATLFYKPSNIFSFQLDELFEGTGAIDLFELLPFTIDRFNRAHDRVNANNLSSVLTYMPWGRTNIAHLRFTDRRAYCDDRSLENSYQMFEADIEHYMTPITSVYFGLGFGRDSYEEGGAKEGDLQSYILGLNYDLTNRTKAGGRFSYFLEDYDDGYNDEYYNLEFTLRHKISNVTNIFGTYRFGLSNTVSYEYRKYNTNSILLSLARQFTNKLSFSFNSGFTLDSYLKDNFIGIGPAAEKERKNYDFAFQIDNQLYKWLDLTFRYRYARNISDFTDESYIDNRYTLSARMEF